MHSSCHRTRRGKLLIDIDRVRKSSVDYTKGKDKDGKHTKCMEEARKRNTEEWLHSTMCLLLLNTPPPPP